MGIFSGILGGIAGAIPGVGSVVSAIANGKAVSKANKATQAGIANASALLTDNYNKTADSLSSYTSGGFEANDMISRLLGIGDHLTGTASNPYTAQQQQAGALSTLKDSPLFQSIFNTGQEAVLQNGAATGGVRGGNIQNALAENGENAFAQTLQNYLSQLGGLAGNGLSASTALGNIGANNANALAGLATGSGQANAGAILGQQSVSNNLQSQITQQLSQALGGFGGIGGATGGATSTAGINNIAKVLQNSSGGSVFTRGF